MFIYADRYSYAPDGSWSGAVQPAPFFSNLYLPFENADRLEITDLALNNLLIQRDDVSIYSPKDSQPYTILPNPGNLTHSTDVARNEFTEYNCNFDNQSTEGGDISFDGEAIESVVVRRSSNRSNFFIWEDIAILPITTGSLYTLNSIIYDPYVEHGIEYQYAIQPIGRTGRGAQYETVKNTANYDDIWLIGSDVQQLMMGYNSVVSGYKYIVKDAAIETIGSKYPYVVRNANVGYTQFQFSCTITAHMNVIGGREVFTPFEDIQVLDEYKGVIGNGQGSSNSGSNDNMDPWCPPPEDFELITRVSANQAKLYAMDGREMFSAKYGTEFVTLEYDMPSSVRKIEIPFDLFPDGIDPLDFLPPGISAEDATAFGNIVGFIREIDCEPIKESDIPEPAPPNIPEGATTFGEEVSSKPSPCKIELDIRTQNSDKPLPVVNAMVRSALKARDAEEEGVAARSGLEVNGALQEPDRVYMLEREFRKRVMEFIYDGKPKIFKSPTEGLILVKLTDISLTPNTVLGRMIYDFSCTMTEIGKIDPSSLARYGFREAIGDKPIITQPEETFNEEEVAQLYGLFAK